MSSPEIQESAAYGRACAGCARAKCKCVLRNDGTGCARCHRLGQPCLPAATIRKRKLAVRKDYHRTAQLEERIDDLVKLLRSQSTDASSTVLPRRPSSSTSPSAGIPTDISSQLGSISDAKNSQQSTPIDQDRTTSGRRIHENVADSSPQSESFLEPTAEQAGEYLEYFRTQHLAKFPFFHIPKDMTASYVQNRRPTLWLAIRAVCCSSVSEQRILEVRIRETLSRRLLIDMDRNLDLLLALIVYLCWANEKLQGKPILAVFASLASSLLFDLKLDRLFLECPCRELDAPNAYNNPIKSVIDNEDKSSEERRAVLGCYITCVNIGVFLRSKPVGWTGYMEECLAHLESRRETPLDALLVALARLAQVSDDYHAASSWKQLQTYPNAPYTPQGIYVQGLLCRLNDVKMSIPNDLSNHAVLDSQICIAEAMIHELLLFPSERNPPMPGLTAAMKAEAFFCCLTGLKRFLDYSFDTGSADLFSYPLNQHVLLVRSIHMVFRLSLIEDPALDRRVVSQTIDIMDSVTRLETLYRAIPETVGLGYDKNNLYTKAADAIKAGGALWRKNLEEAGAIPGVIQSDPPKPDNCTDLEYSTLYDPASHTWLMEMFSFADVC